MKLRPIEYIERFIFFGPRIGVIALVSLLVIMKSGIWIMPNLDFSRRLAENPFVNPFADPGQHYLVWNWFAPFVAWLTGATGWPEFFFLHLLFSLCFYAVVVTLAFRRLSERNARIALLVFAILPVSATSFYWVGMDGAILMLLAAAFIFPRNLAWALALGALAGMQHFEQAIVAAALLLFLVSLRRLWLRLPSLTSIPWCASLSAGVVLGKLALIAIFDRSGMVVETIRFYWVLELWPDVMVQFVLHAHFTVWAMLALGWVLFLKDAFRGRSVVPLALAIAGSSVLLGLVFDQTRVLAVVTFPILFVAWLQDDSFLDSLGERFMAWLFVAWITVPWLWAYGGYPQWSVLPYDLVVLVSSVTGVVELPDVLPWWPFHYTGP